MGSSGWRTVGERASARFTEKKSEFIGSIAPVRTEEEALAFIASVRKQYADAKHNVYAYLLRENNIARFSDDGEPHGTAGLPVLDVLRKADVTDAAVVVTRYFGGILLGTGGLVRAYTQSAKSALELAGVREMRPLAEFSVRIAYPDRGKVEALLSAFPALRLGEEFSSEVGLRLAVGEEDAEKLCASLAEATGGRAAVVRTGTRFGTV